MMFNHHPPCNPDLAPNDFRLFLHHKKFLAGQRLQNDKEAEMSVTLVPIPGGRVLRYRIQKLLSLYDKCLSFGGEYVEKSSKLTVSVSINLINKLGLVSVNDPRYFIIQ